MFSKAEMGARCAGWVRGRWWWRWVAASLSVFPIGWGHASLAADEEPIAWPSGWENFGEIDRWAFRGGVATVTWNRIGELLRGKFNRATGDAGGELYLLGASYTLADLRGNFPTNEFKPQLNAVGVLGLVNENRGSPFMDYNAGLTIRWRQFPWDHVLPTTLETGVGLSYTQRVMQVERIRLPDRKRSHLKYYWPIELGFSLRSARQHQIILFIHHQSGGRVFDVGGSNHVGVGYRYGFRER